MTDSGVTYTYDFGQNYNNVTVEIVSKDERNCIRLILDKQLDVSNEVMNKLDKYHEALRLVAEAIRDGYVEVNNEVLS